jgi:hypothetical protein
VLRITWPSRKGRGLTLEVEGQIVGPWVDTLRAACTEQGRRRLHLDLAAVTYVDAAGVELLRELMAEGVAIAACSNFVAELLRPGP